MQDSADGWMDPFSEVIQSFVYLSWDKCHHERGFGKLYHEYDQECHWYVVCFLPCTINILPSTFADKLTLPGTNSMLPKEYGGVVDLTLKVYGMSNIHVVDISILPFVRSFPLSSGLNDDIHLYCRFLPPI